MALATLDAVIASGTGADAARHVRGFLAAILQPLEQKEILMPAW